MRIYISGPISGKDKRRTLDRFRNAADVIAAAGHTPVSPTQISGWGLSWSTYMQIAFDVLKSGDIDAVYMLSGWQDSHGACLERYTARVSGMPVFYQNRDDRIRYKKPGFGEGATMSTDFVDKM